MHDDPGHEDIPVDPNAGYERRDVQVSLILWAFVFIAVLSVVAFFSMKWMYGGFQQLPSPSATGAVPSVALEAETFVHPSVGPELQDNPVADRIALELAQGKMVESYGWVDEQQGIAHIPVAEAMQEIAKNGLPVWEAPQDESSTEAPAEAPAEQ